MNEKLGNPVRYMDDEKNSLHQVDEEKMGRRAVE